MNSRMILQINSLGKGQSANCALIVLFPAVQFLMRPQTGVAGEETTTNVAAERFTGIPANGVRVSS